MNIKNILLLFLTAAIWGVAFVAQSMGMEHVGPFTFSCARFFLGGLVLLPFVWYSGKKKGNTMVIPGHRKTLLIGGLSCGIALCLATNFQQIGIQYTTVGKAGFITACYIVIVPVMGLLLGKKCSPMVAGAVVLSLGGLYLLCMAGGELAMNRGDLLMLVCALLFSAHIMIIDFFSPVVDGVKMSCIQFFVSAVLSGAAMLLWEKPDMGQLLMAWAPVLYAGVLSCGVGYTLQIIGQKGMNPTVASLILSLESSISVLAGWVILGQRLTSRELWGCVLMFGAIILAQLPNPVERKGKRARI